MYRKWFSLLLLVVVILTTLVLPDMRPARASCLAQTADGQCFDPTVYGTEMRALAAEMAANPTPNVTPIPIDKYELYRRAYRRVMEATPTFDAPGGNANGQIPQGFVFVNAGDTVNGFTQITPTQWVPDQILGPVNKAVSQFAGVLLPEGIPTRPFGWMLLDTRPSRTPGAKPMRGTPDIPRYALVNIFAVAVVDTWEWYLVGPDQWVLQTRMAKIKPVQKPEGVQGKWFAIDLYEQTMVAFQDDKAVYATLIASGLEKWSTAEGVHKIFDRHKLVKMAGAEGRPEYWYLPQVPYVMYFNTSEQALHGAYWHDGFGYRRSRGCINLSITDAHWAYDWTEDQPDASVYIFHSAEYRPGAPQ